MTDPMSYLGQLVSELRRRGVLQVGTAYLVLAAGIVQVTAVTVQALFLPQLALTAVVVLAILGLPVALVTSWAFELTPEGVRRTEDAEGGAGPSLARGSRIALVGTTVVVMSLVGWGFWEVYLRRAPEARAAPAPAERPPLEPNHVAVLYLEDISQGQDLGYLAEGLTQNLIHELSGVEGLTVVSSNGVKPYRDGSLPVDSIGRILHAGSVVVGTVQNAGDSVRVNVQLVDATTGAQIDSRRIDESAGNLFALQDAVSSQVARFLRLRLGQTIQLRHAREGAHDPEAWKTYQVALRLRDDADSLRLARDTAGAFDRYQRADSLLAVAADMDPEWTEPTVERAWTALSWARTRSPATTDADTAILRRGIEDADRVLADHPGHAPALEARGNLEWYLAGARRYGAGDEAAADEALSAAERDLRAATTRDPDLARAWAVLAYILQRQGKFEEARVDARRMGEADPYLSSNATYLYITASLALELRELDRADSLLAVGENLYPRLAAYPSQRLIIAASRSKGPAAVAEAWELLDRTEALLGGPYQTGRFDVAAVLARSGLSDSARAVARRARALDPDKPDALNNEAYVALQLGDRERALRLLGQYLEAAPDQRDYVARDFWWAPLHGDPRFQALVDPGHAAADSRATNGS